MTKEKFKKPNFITISITITIIIISLWVLTYFLLIDNDKKGVIGDMFGSINALFSGLALAGIILTILLQRKEISLQREEMAEHRKQLSRSAEAQEKTEKLISKEILAREKSAKINALSTIIDSYNNDMQRNPNNPLLLKKRNEKIETLTRQVKFINELTKELK